jgi:signal transduction histidine kinase
MLRALQGEQSTVSDMEIRRDGVPVPLRIWSRPVRDPDDGISHAVTAFQDISEEARIRRRSRHFAGRLKASDAARLSGAGEQPKFARQIDRIERQAWQAERIISDLLDFSRSAEPQREVVVPGELVQETLSRRPLADAVAVDLQIDEQARVFVDALQISHALSSGCSSRWSRPRRRG